VTPLTPRQREVLFALAVLTTRMHMSPTHRELSEAIGSESTNNAFQVVRQLRIKGYVSIGHPKQARSMRVLHLPDDMPLPCCTHCGASFGAGDSGKAASE